MSTLRSESLGNSSDTEYGSYSFLYDHKPFKGNSFSPDRVTGSKGWINHHGLGKCYSHDQLNVLDPDVIEFLTSSGVKENAKGSGENKLIEEYYTTYPSKNSCNSFLQEFESTTNDDLLSNVRSMDSDSCSSPLFEKPKKLCSDMDSHWIGLKKIEPWWHAADKDDLPSLVSRGSSHRIINRDLPEVQTERLEKVLDDGVHCFEQIKEKMIDKETEVSHVADYTEGDLDSVKSLGKRGLMDCMLQDSDGAFSTRDCSKTAKVDSSDTQEPTSGDLSRTELLEALCHSQTRAREAEKSAQEACDEKEHIIDLFFQQASYLLAYRQWVRILQLEILCLQFKSKDQISSFNHVPTLSHLIRSGKGVVLRKNRKRAVKKKPSGRRFGVRKCAIAFAVGLSLAGAGLLVGWTIGWFFPAF